MNLMINKQIQKPYSMISENKKNFETDKKTSVEKLKSHFDWKSRCINFFKKSNFELLLKNKKVGIKQVKIVLTYLFLLVDCINNAKYGFALPTQQQIADFCGTHISWVKQVKAKFFNSKNSFFKNEKDYLYKFFNSEKLESFKIKGFKDLLITEQEGFVAEQNNIYFKNVFVSKTKRYTNFYFSKSLMRTTSFRKFFSFTSIDADKKFRNNFCSKKTKKIKNSFFRSLFNKEKWKENVFFWKVIRFINENIILRKRNSFTDDMAINY